MRDGTAMPEPNAITSRAPNDGMNERILAVASAVAERMKAWSRSLESRITNSVLHWEMIVGSISNGRCVTRPR